MVLAVPSEAALAELERKLRLAGIAHVAIREPDAPHLGALTAIGLVPVADRTAVRKLLSSLPKYGKRPELAPASACRECAKEGPSPNCYTCNGGRRREATM